MPYTPGVIHRAEDEAFVQVVETSVTNNSSFQNYPHLDDHTITTSFLNRNDKLLPAAHKPTKEKPLREYN